MWYTMIVMTTVTFGEDLQLPSNFKTLAAFLSYLEEQGFATILRELPDSEVTEEMQQSANDAIRRYEKNPSSFHDL